MTVMTGCCCRFFLFFASLLSLSQALPKIDPVFIADFDQENVVSLDDAGAPVDVQISPDGTLMMVPEKDGKLWIIQNFDPVAGLVPRQTEALQITKICTNVERGFGGTAFHPRFGIDNRWIYLYYTYDKNNSCDASGSAKKGPINRLSRFTLGTDNIVDKSTEQVFFESPILPYGGHNSGQIRFGADGYLYVSVGDGGGGISQENDDGILYPQALDMLLGKILRLTDSGDIPPTNPFTDPSTSARCNKNGWSSKASIKCQEIYSYGLRNPFRFALDPNAARMDGKTRFFINDVGRHTWESVHEGGDGFSGANYGYPDREGPCEKKMDKKCAPDSRFLSPVHWYHHDDEEGGAATGNAFYPNDAGWPLHFQDSYFYGDYAFGGLYRVAKGMGACAFPQCDPPISEYAQSTMVFSDLQRITALTFGPYMGGQALYVATRGHDGIRGYKGIIRIKYTGPPVAPLPGMDLPFDDDSVVAVAPPVQVEVETPAIPVAPPVQVQVATPAIPTEIDTVIPIVVESPMPDDTDDFVLPAGGITFDVPGAAAGPAEAITTVIAPSAPTPSPISYNRIPKAIASASTTLGFPPLFVKFDGTESYDPDGLDGPPLTYQWDFNGDGIIDSASSTGSFKYMKSGIYMAKLTVRDVRGVEGTTNIKITVEDAPPRTRIIEPRQDAKFSVGDEIKLKGTAFDVDGGLLPDTSLTWEIRMHHVDHWHTVLQQMVGNNLVLPAAPAPADLSTSKDGYLLVLLTATDNAGLSSTTKTILKPKLVDFVLDSNPSGLYVTANGEEFQTPATVTTWANTEVKVEAKSQKDNSGNAYTWNKWSDGGAKSHQFLIAGDTNVAPIVADFRPGSGDIVLSIDSPADGSTFAVGDAIKLSASATGADGGLLDLSGDMMSWEAKLRNETHAKTILAPTPGNHILGFGPEPLDFEFAKTNYLEVTVTAVTMVGGSAARTVTTVNVYPKKVDLTFDAVPSGLFLEIDGDMYRTPVSVTTWENHKFHVEAPSQRMNGEGDELVTYVWDSWTDEGAQAHDFVTPAHKHHNPIVASFRPLAFGEELPSVTYANDADGGGAGGSSKTTIIGAVIGACCACIALILAFVAWTYKKPRKAPEKEKKGLHFVQVAGPPPGTPPISPTGTDISRAVSPYGYPEY